MKYLIIALLLFSTAHAQDTLYSKEIRDTMTPIAIRVYREAKADLKELVQALKQPTGHAYHVLVNQIRVNALSYLFLLICGILIIMFWFKSLRSKEQWLSDSDTPTVMGATRMIQLAVGFGLFLAGVCNADVIFTGLFNPEYGAIKEIVSFFK